MAFPPRLPPATLESEMNFPQPGSSLPEATDGSANAANPAPPYPRFTVFDIFFGPEGLRALWGILLFLAIIATAQTPLVLFTVPDISGTGSAVQLAATGTARWCQLVAPAGNTYVVRWGDSVITTSRGSIIAAGAGQFIPPMVGPNPGGGSGVFSLSTIYVLVQSGDKITATCGR